MNRIIPLSALLFAAGCASAADASPPANGDESTDELSLSPFAQQLTGAYEVVTGNDNPLQYNGFSADFRWVVLKSDGTYFTEGKAVCDRPPCAQGRETGRFVATAPATGITGTLTLKPQAGSVHKYQVQRDREAGMIKLSKTGDKFAGFTSVGTYCRTTKDCDGQSFDRGACQGEPICEAGLLRFGDSTSCSLACER